MRRLFTPILTKRLFAPLVVACAVVAGAVAAAVLTGGGVASAAGSPSAPSVTHDDDEQPVGTFEVSGQCDLATGQIVVTWILVNLADRLFTVDEVFSQDAGQGVPVSGIVAHAVLPASRSELRGELVGQQRFSAPPTPTLTSLSVDMSSDQDGQRAVSGVFTLDPTSCDRTATATLEEQCNSDVVVVVTNPEEDDININLNGLTHAVPGEGTFTETVPVAATIELVLQFVVDDGDGNGKDVPRTNLPKRTDCEVAAPPALPVTGASLTGLVVAALALVGAGVALLTYTRRRRRTEA